MVLRKTGIFFLLVGLLNTFIQATEPRSVLNQQEEIYKIFVCDQEKEFFAPTMTTTDSFFEKNVRGGQKEKATKLFDLTQAALLAGKVTSASWSPLVDYYFAAAGFGGDIAVIDACNLKKIKTYKGDKKNISSLAWHPQFGAFLAAGTDDGLIKILSDSYESLSFDWHTGVVSGLSWHPKKEHIFASGSLDGKVLLWDIHKISPIKDLKGHDGCITDLVWYHGNQDILATASDDMSIILWSFDDDVCIKSVLRGHQAAITSLSWNPYRSLQLASGSLDGSVMIWDCSSDPGYKVLTKNSDGVGAVAWHPGSFNILAIGFVNGTIEIWDVKKEHCLLQLRGHKTGIAKLSWQSPHVFVLTSLTSGGQIKMWQL